MLTDNKRIIASLIDIEGECAEDIYNSIAVPPDDKMGDYALPCFAFAKKLRKAPTAIANELATAINSAKKPPIDRAEAVNGYLNIYIDKLYYAKDLLEKIIREGKNYGSSHIGEGRTVCIDYSSINIAKPFHIGHLCTTVIGGALYKVYKKLGYKTVGINHLGDWGTQFGKLIVAFKLWGKKERLDAEGMTYLNELYVKYHRESEQDVTLDDKARYWFRKIEEGDKDAVELFDLFKEITLKEVKKTYKRLKISFDSYNGEAFYNDKMQPVLDELDEKKLLVESDGAKVVELSQYDMPPCLLVKADGATLYATRDLAAAFYRKKRYDFYKCLYVVAYQQNLHFRQFFKVLELMGKDWGLYHVAFGMVSLEDGAMSTRKGKVILLEDVLNKAVEKSLAIIAEKSPGLKDKQKISEKVGVGAVIFYALYNNRIKDIVFSYDKVLNFDGETGPYVQYTNARCNSVLKKAGFKALMNDDLPADFESINNVEGLKLITLLEDFPNVLADVTEKNEPCYVSRYLVGLCQAFNRFYYAHRIMDVEAPQKKARAMLVSSVHTVIEEGLRLLGIFSPAQM
ncbi:MAG: arginine--tRNA ligase [Clostridia bacterium]|nr:arginine--tRNA ligase [Clostridia bacterium]